MYKLNNIGDERVTTWRFGRIEKPYQMIRIGRFVSMGGYFE